MPDELIGMRRVVGPADILSLRKHGRVFAAEMAGLVLLVSLLGSTIPENATGDAQAVQLEKARSYLRNTYDSTVGLMSETPFADEQGKRIFWMNDNVLALAAFMEHGTDSDKVLAENVHDRIVELAR